MIDVARDWLRPAPLRPGARVWAIAPAGPFEARLVWRALGWLRERYEVCFTRRIFDRSGYLAGDDGARARELRTALEEPDVAAIFCARGGYGVSRFAHQLDWSRLRASPRWIVGFSDITALHVEAMHVGVASVHGPNLTGLGRGDERARRQLIDVLEGATPQRFDALEVLRGGAAEGILCGGNLTLLHSCAAAGRLALPRGAALLLEDVGERPYRIDRMLTTLVVGGHLDGVCAVVIGELDRCGAGDDGVSALDAMLSCLAPLGVPIVAGLPLGHGVRNDAVVLGTEVRLDASGAAATLTFG